MFCWKRWDWGSHGHQFDTCHILSQQWYSQMIEALSQQDNAACYTEQIAQEWLKKIINMTKVLSQFPSSTDLCPVLQLSVCGLQKSDQWRWAAAKVLEPDTTEHLLRSCSVHALIGQSCFGSTRSTNSNIKQVVLMFWLISVYCSLHIPSLFLTWRGNRSAWVEQHADIWAPVITVRVKAFPEGPAVVELLAKLLCSCWLLPSCDGP